MGNKWTERNKKKRKRQKLIEIKSEVLNETCLELEELGWTASEEEKEIIAKVISITELKNKKLCALLAQLICDISINRVGFGDDIFYNPMANSRIYEDPEEHYEAFNETLDDTSKKRC